MSDEPTALRSTGIGSWPGVQMSDAIKIAFAECPELPYLPELPARGPHADLVGRGTAFLSGLAFDLQPAGWRLTDASSRDHRRAITTVRADLDQLEEQAQGYAGPIKIAVAGPWTLAATIEHPRGDKAVADPGARRDLAQSLTDGLVTLVAELRRRLPEVGVIIQLDEPLLPSVVAGRLRTASGFARHRSVDVPEISAAYTPLVEQLAATDTPLWVHCCAAGVPVRLLHDAGAAALLVDLDRLTATQWDEIGPALEAGLVLGAGALPTGWALGPDQVAERTLAALRRLELDPAITSRTVLTPACGLASASPDTAVRALRTVRTAAGIVTERLAD